MTVTKRAAMIWWVGGLIAFAIVVGVHFPLITAGVPGGIVDHQSAPDAATVDAIQNSWRSDGLLNQAALAMIADFIFIGIYGVGCVLAGMYYRAKSDGKLRFLGLLAVLSGLVFLATDYGETIAQFIQLMALAGDDGLAAIASTLQPIKSAAWIGGFITVALALILERFSSSGT
ncbi:MAG: hypothetical protein ABJP48_00935 [Erythrobacter sp.]